MSTKLYWYQKILGLFVAFSRVIFCPRWQKRVLIHHSTPIDFKLYLIPSLYIFWRQLKILLKSWCCTPQQIPHWGSAAASHRWSAAWVEAAETSGICCDYHKLAKQLPAASCSGCCTEMVNVSQSLVFRRAAMIHQPEADKQDSLRRWSAAAMVTNHW